MANNPQKHGSTPSAPAAELVEMADPSAFKATITTGASEQVAVETTKNGTKYASPMQDPVLLAALQSIQDSIKAFHESQGADLRNGINHTEQLIRSQFGKTLDLTDPAVAKAVSQLIYPINPTMAAHLQGKTPDEGFLAGVDQTLSAPITFKHVVYGGAGVAFLVFVWEGIAYKFDLPRLGMFDPSNPLKVLPKKM